MRTYIVLTIAVACLTSAVTTLLIAGTTSAQAASDKISVISDLEVAQVEGSWAEVAPGSVGTRIVACPNHEIATGGGFHLQGTQSLDDPAVTADYADKEGTGGIDYWHVTVANPKLADPVEMQAVVLCLVPKETLVSG